MACTRPITMKQKDAFGIERVQSFPCGRCPACLKDKQNGYKLRLLEEFNNWTHAYFFTLTYSDESLPLNDLGNSSASIKDIQGWLKRFRIRYERSRLKIEGIPYKYLAFPSVRELCSLKFKYFICAEYAPDGKYVDRHGRLRRSTMRPHYHGIIYSDEPFCVFSSLFKDWSNNFGFVHFREVACGREQYSSVANYVSKYCCKGEFASRRDEIERGEIERAFMLCSKGLGLSYVDRMSSWHNPFRKCSNYPVNSQEKISTIVDRMYVGDGSFQYHMPRYWKDRIYKLLEYKPYDYWDNKQRCFVKKMVKRYTCKNLLSLQIHAELQNRFIGKSADSLAQFEILSEGGSHGLGYDYFGTGPESIAAKELKIRDKLAKFYRDNAYKNNSLCFG